MYNLEIRNVICHREENSLRIGLPAADLYWARTWRWWFC